METIKIIDLLNKIAKGELIPKKIKYNNAIYIYDFETKRYLSEKTRYTYKCFSTDELNAEIEIIDEPDYEDAINLVKEGIERSSHYRDGGKENQRFKNLLRVLTEERGK